MGALDNPRSDHELDASFMYAAGHASAMAMIASFGQTPASLAHVMPWRPWALPGHSTVKTGFA